MMQAVLQYAGYLALLVVLAYPLGIYIDKVMQGRWVWLSPLIRPAERMLYRLTGTDEREEMTWRRYLGSALAFNFCGFVLLFALLMLQGSLPLNPLELSGLEWPLAFNTAVSFVTNTNWQAYRGELQLSYAVQMLGLTVQNFASAGTGMAVLYALIRGFVRTQDGTIGNFWTDLTRSTGYVLVPLAVVVTLLIGSQGVVQNFDDYTTYTLSERVVAEDGTAITKGVVPGGPAASQIAIKQLGTNGGGFFGANSAHPLENPTPFSNLVEMTSILLIPAALCFSFGRAVGSRRQGVTIFAAMLVLLVLGMGIIGFSEQAGTAPLAQNGAVLMEAGNMQPGGNMEGKETRFGIAGSAAWAEFTTAASNGSVNSMLDSYTPLGGLAAMLNIQLGEVVFGGTGCGLYGMLCFAILTVFISGLMVGRTPEFLGKKIEPYEMKMAVLACLATPVAILAGSGIAAMVPGVADSLSNHGAHGLSELLYAYSSCGGNNGSAFAGFGADTVFLNVSLGMVMLFARFLPMTAVVAIAGHLAGKKKLAVTEGTLRTDNAMFAGLLIAVVLLVGALSFFPVLSLGPIAEFLQ
ncbi:potassium-transporting ATPase subunit KdpA [Anaerovibrio sp.]|uniref:potassium-transporting ATPase subunit KdpA n=1 Tax=Anaerovibrio sp. TaxID=1872532 RepID=UPI003F161528